MGTRDTLKEYSNDKLRDIADEYPNTLLAHDARAELNSRFFTSGGFIAWSVIGAASILSALTGLWIAVPVFAGLAIWGLASAGQNDPTQDTYIPAQKHTVRPQRGDFEEWSHKEIIEDRSRMAIARKQKAKDKRSGKQSVKWFTMDTE